MRPNNISPLECSPVPAISVIVCTHNPRLSYLRRVLEALQSQNFPNSKWELLLIDNASDHPVNESVDLNWHPSARYVREEDLALTRARLRGISESRGKLLIFVDDDNVLRPDYLEKALAIAEEHPLLGAWSGQVLPEFEVDPPKELIPMLGLLCLRAVEFDVWGNNLSWNDAPWGAGMCIRRQVAQRYSEYVSDNPLRLSLGPIGNKHACHDDTDLAITSLDIGLGMGLFRSLSLTHLIPEKRLKESYLLERLENARVAFVILSRVRLRPVEELPQGRKKFIEWLKRWKKPPLQRKADEARLRGHKKGLELTADLPTLKWGRLSSCPTPGQPFTPETEVSQ